jgi:deoxyuridine 5'-triphosphate nucleotidohydrolase
LLTSIDTTIDPIPVVEEPVLLVNTTNGQLSKQVTSNAAGLDLFANKSLSILAHNRSFVQLGIKIALPMRTYRQITSRSGLSVKGIDVGAGVIDSDYRGELQVVVINYTDQPFSVNTGNRIAQLIVKKIAFPTPVRTSNLDKTSQGIDGFSLTGIVNIDLGLCDAISRHISEDTFGKNIHNALENKSIPLLGRMIAADWTIDGKLLLFQEKCYIPTNQLLCRHILQLYHDSPAVGHPEQQNTAALLEWDYYWLGMRSFVSAYVHRCAICQQIKVNMHPTIPLLQLILAKLRDHSFQFVTCDFITALPQSDGFTALMVVVDYDSTKGAVFIPCTKKTDALETAELYYKHVFKRFGWLNKFLSDQSPQFDSLVLKELWRILGMEECITTAYHPQMDGEMERMNQEIEIYL